MKDGFCVLFDMDGVLVDTEAQYDIICSHIGIKYNSGIEHFEKIVKGTTMNNIIANYFTHLSGSEKQSLIDDLVDFEQNMDFSEIAGATKFLKELKDNGIKTGLVTSSDNKKLEAVYKQVDFRKTVDTIVSANRIISGKPDPMCYLLAAEDLGYKPENCFVFEDSFAGLESGTQAGMIVIGLSTTHPKEFLEGKCIEIIPNFENFTLNDLRKIHAMKHN